MQTPSPTLHVSHQPGAGFRRPTNAGLFSSDEFTRREFLRGASAVAGALAFAPALDLQDRALAQDGRPSEDPQDFDSHVRKRMRDAHLPSLAMAAVTTQQVVQTDAYGWANIKHDRRATPDTAYILASISKTVVCGALMQLWEAGSIGLDADVNGYLPFEVHEPSHPAVAITPRMLLTHTSGIREDWIWGTLADPTPYGWSHGDSPVSLHDVLAAYLVPGGDLYDPDVNFTGKRPGKAFQYSSLAVDLAAYLVEVVSGVPFGEFCMDNLFVPLGMNDTGYHLADIPTSELATPYRYAEVAGEYRAYPQYGMPDYPCSMLRSSAASLSRWLRCFMNRGELEGTRILQEATVDEIFRPQVTDTWGGQQALIWYYVNWNGEVWLGHGGSNYFGVRTEMNFVPAKGNGLIMLTNRCPLTSLDQRKWNNTYDGIYARVFA